MGGCGSRAAWRRYLPEVLEVQRALDEEQRRALEQQNLLRFKIEIMVNMLSMEEKKNEMMSRRLDTLKLLLAQQGVTEQMFIEVLKTAAVPSADAKTPPPPTTTTTTATAAILGSGGIGDDRSASLINTSSHLLTNSNNADNLLIKKTTSLIETAGKEAAEGMRLPSSDVGLIDVAGALQRGAEEFRRFRSDIFCAFADGVEGKIVPTLTHGEFVRQLYTVTEQLSKVDIQVLGMRFDDGTGSVSIPEFLEFFSSSPQMRAARASASAVRLSFDMIQIEEANRVYVFEVEGEEGEDRRERNGNDPDPLEEGMSMSSATGISVTSSRARHALSPSPGQTNTQTEQPTIVNGSGLMWHHAATVDILDRAVNKLLAMWPVVCDVLQRSLNTAAITQQTAADENIGNLMGENSDTPTYKPIAASIASLSIQEGGSNKINNNNNNNSSSSSSSKKSSDNAHWSMQDAKIDPVLPLDDFESILLRVCGRNSGVLSRAVAHSTIHCKDGERCSVVQDALEEAKKHRTTAAVASSDVEPPTATGITPDTLAVAMSPKSPYRPHQRLHKAKQHQNQETQQQQQQQPSLLPAIQGYHTNGVSGDNLSSFKKTKLSIEDEPLTTKHYDINNKNSTSSTSSTSATSATLSPYADVTSGVFLQHAATHFSELHIVPLTHDDVGFIADRFELAGCVHYGQFVNIIDELYHAKQREHNSVSAAFRVRQSIISVPASMQAVVGRDLEELTGRGEYSTAGGGFFNLSLNPFRRTSEWRVLRAALTGTDLYDHGHGHGHEDGDHSEDDYLRPIRKGRKDNKRHSAARTSSSLSPSPCNSTPPARERSGSVEERGGRRKDSSPPVPPPSLSGGDPSLLMGRRPTLHREASTFHAKLHRRQQQQQNSQQQFSVSSAFDRGTPGSTPNDTPQVKARKSIKTRSLPQQPLSPGPNATHTYTGGGGAGAGVVDNGGGLSKDEGVRLKVTQYDNLRNGGKPPVVTPKR